MAGVFRLAPPSQLRPCRQEKRPTLWKKSAALVMFLTCPCGRSAPMIGAHHGAHFPYWDGMCGGRHRCPVRFESSSSHNAGVPHWASQIKRGGLLLWQRARKNLFECTFTVLFLISLSEKAKCMSVHTVCAKQRVVFLDVTNMQVILQSSFPPIWMICTRAISRVTKEPPSRCPEKCPQPKSYNICNHNIKLFLGRRNVQFAAQKE